VKKGTRDATYFVAGGIEYNDLVGADQADIQIARLRERDARSLWQLLAGNNGKPMHELQIRRRRVVHQRQPVDGRLARKDRRNGDREVDVLSGRVYPCPERSAGKSEESRDAWVCEPD